MNGLKKKGFLLCALLSALLICAAASGELPAIQPGEAVRADWRSLGVQKKDKLAVSGAPFEDAWRGAKGKAAVSAAEYFSVLGSAQGGEWLLIEYAVDRKSGRIGWIRTPENFRNTDAVRQLWPERALYRLTRDALLTDDPGGSRREIRTLRAEETVIGMMTLDAGGTGWICAETEADGKTVWGFVESGALESVPLYRREEDRLVIREGVTSMGYSWDETRKIRPGDIHCPAVSVYEEFGETVRSVRFPSSLRMLGDESFYAPKFGELVLPGSLESVSQWALYGGSVDRMVLAEDYTAGIPGGEYTTFGGWEVRAGNPVYSARDGVLFSADGKTLLSYPNGLTAVHYDVPAGTEKIAARAFHDDMMSYPLQTVSLPIGLKSIGEHAFSGCGRLHSLTVPLTVTELDPKAFSCCVSLERLSLPPGLSVSFEDDWALYEHFPAYTGDNGATLTAPRTNEWEEPSPDGEAAAAYGIWVSGTNGEGAVPVYPSAEAETPSGELRSGAWRMVYRVRNGRGLTGSGDGGEEWIPLENTLPVSRDVFFTVSKIIPSPEGEKELAEQGLAGFTSCWFDAESMTGGFAKAEAGNTWEVTEGRLPADRLILFRPHTGDGRSFGLLNAPAEEQPVRLYDVPDGTPQDWTYRGDQAEILESAGDWIRIRTSRSAGWVKADSLIAVKQEEP